MSEIHDAVVALCDEPPIVDTSLGPRVSRRFLARLTLLRVAAGLPVDDDDIIDAKQNVDAIE